MKRAQIADSSSPDVSKSYLCNYLSPQQGPVNHDCATLSVMCEIAFILPDGGERLKVPTARAVELSSLSGCHNSHPWSSEPAWRIRGSTNSQKYCTGPKPFQCTLAQTANEPHLLREASLGETANMEQNKLELTSVLSSIS